MPAVVNVITVPQDSISSSEVTPLGNYVDDHNLQLYAHGSKHIFFIHSIIFRIAVVIDSIQHPSPI